MMKRPIIPLIFLAASLVSCLNQQQPPVLATGTATPETLLSDTPFAGTSTAIPSKTTRSPDHTATFQITETGTAKPARSSKPTFFPGQVATWEASDTQFAQTHAIDCKGYPDKKWVRPGFSPDGSWRFTFCLEPNTGHPYTKLIQTKGTLSWDVPYFETLGDIPKHYGQMVTDHWTSDGNYVYLTPYWCCLDGPAMIFSKVRGLYRLNLKTGALDDVTHGGAAIAFSPDDNYLAYSKENIVHVLDLSNNEDTPIPLDSAYESVGIFVWSPDSQHIVFVAAFEGWVDTFLSWIDGTKGTPAPNQNGFSLLRIDIDTKTVETLIDNDYRCFAPQLTGASQGVWTDWSSLIIYDREGNEYVFNIMTKEMILYPTPYPTP